MCTHETLCYHGKTKDEIELWLNKCKSDSTRSKIETRESGVLLAKKVSVFALLTVQKPSDLRSLSDLALKLQDFPGYRCE